VIRIPIYGALALRCVYGGSALRTPAKGVAIALIYAVTSMMTFAVVVYRVSVRGRESTRGSVAYHRQCG